MKKFIILLILLITPCLMLAQAPTLNVILKGGGTSSFPLANIDSITFSGGSVSQREFVFCQDESGVSVIKRANEDFSVITQLTDADTSCYAPKYSPDGSRIAYQRQNSFGQGDVWVMNSDGTNKHLVWSNGRLHAGDPTWHNDGNRIIYWRHASVATETQDQVIMIVNSDGTNNQVLFDNPSDKDMAPVMNPANSSEVLYYFDPENWSYNAAIKIRNLTLGTDETIKGYANNGFGPWALSWSPDGRYILYRETDASFHARCIRYDRNTHSNLTIVDITGGTGNEVGARFSPDGTKIYYFQRTNNNATHEIYQADIDGLNATLLYSWTGAPAGGIDVK